MARSTMAAGLAALALAPQAAAFTATPGAGPVANGRTLRASQGVQGIDAAPAATPLASVGAVGLVAVAGAVGFSRGAAQRRGAKKAAQRVVSLRAAKVGDAIPNVGLDKGFPPDKVMLGDYCKGKKVVLVGLPGAFTPT
eukprot:gb/GFBE01042347.1/.p1 GENE.gb/GFBE01042347.1/~~gb/GFBE01042347.1/.p1  ORF type:complete len:139 (+),score=18.82 gb/GFBE01042347.1/:1-417(+)